MRFVIIIKLGGMIKMNYTGIKIKRNFLITRLADQYLARSYEIVVPICKKEIHSMKSKILYIQTDIDIENSKYLVGGSVC
jgi:hypothetical protein